MNSIETQKVALKWATNLLEMVIADVTPEQLHWHPPGTANPIGALYAHAVCGVDTLCNYLLLGQPTLFAGEWAGRTGFSEPAWQMSREWALALQVDLAQARAYAQAVYASAEALLANAPDGFLEQKRDLTQQGFGMVTVDWLLSAICIGHVNNMSGEISCLKGIQGGKGYPF